MKHRYKLACALSALALFAAKPATAQGSLTEIKVSYQPAV
jgi:hypothetical protein